MIGPQFKWHMVIATQTIVIAVVSSVDVVFWPADEWIWFSGARRSGGCECVWMCNGDDGDWELGKWGFLVLTRTSS
jgi:hypothetical protein